jgi:hypothetical protein
MKLLALLAAAVLAFSATTALAAASTPRKPATTAISTSYAKRVIRGYINRNFGVALGPYFGDCQKLARNNVRCEVQFKAGLYWRCGRVSVREIGDTDYITARLPIGC